MATYAFIDVPNTNGTARECLGFKIDWHKLYELMTNEKWACKQVFYYKGYKGDTELKQMQKLEETGYTLKTKLTHIHKDRKEIIKIVCECGTMVKHERVIKGNQKSNCDVELTVDALNTLKPGDQAILFSGDGDFTYLADNLINNGVFVTIVSSKNRDRNGHLRFSTRLTALIDLEEKGKRRCRFIHLNNWKNRIEKIEE